MSGMSRNCRESLDHYHCAPVRSCLKEGRTFYMQGMMTWEDRADLPGSHRDHKSRKVV